jgi:GH24 family phage-related lysozyme (muramidase)
MAHFINAKGSRISNSIQHGNVGANIKIGVWGAAGVIVAPNDQSIAGIKTQGPDKSNNYWYLLSAKRPGHVMVEAKHGADVWDFFQLAVDAPRVLSQAGLSFLALHEGFVGHLYNDTGGHATIGHGHLVHRGRVGTNAAAEAPYAAGITKPQALALLNRDVAKHVAAVDGAVRVRVAQTQFDALVSFSFNVGDGAMRGSNVVNLVNHGGSAAQIHNAFLQWIHSGGKIDPGLINRRNAESNLFNHGRY